MKAALPRVLEGDENNSKGIFDCALFTRFDNSDFK